MDCRRKPGVRETGETGIRDLECALKQQGGPIPAVIRRWQKIYCKQCNIKNWFASAKFEKKRILVIYPVIMARK